MKEIVFKKFLQSLCKMPIFLSIVCAMAWGSQAIFLKTSLAKADIRHVVLLTLLINCLIIFTWIAINTNFNFIKRFNDASSINFIIAGSLNYFLGRWLYYSSIRFIGPTKATAISSAYPMVSILFAFLFLGELLTMKRYLGIGLTLLGVYLILVRRKK